MVPMQKLSPSPDGVKLLFANFLKRSAGKDRLALEQMVLENRAAIWTVTGRGFFVVSVEENEYDFRTLTVHCMEGVHCLTMDVRESFLDLASRERCDCIYCESVNPRVVNALHRLGFKTVGYRDQKTLLRMDVEHGR